MKRGLWALAALVAVLVAGCAAGSRDISVRPGGPLGEDYGIVVGRLRVRFDNVDGVNAVIEDGLDFTILNGEPGGKFRINKVGADEHGFFYLENIPVSDRIGVAKVILEGHDVGSDRQVSEGAYIGDNTWEASEVFQFAPGYRVLCIDLTYIVHGDGSLKYRANGGPAPLDWFAAKYPNSDWSSFFPPDHVCPLMEAENQPR